MGEESDKDLEQLRTAFVEALYDAISTGAPLIWSDCPTCGGPRYADVARVALICARCAAKVNR